MTEITQASDIAEVAGQAVNALDWNAVYAAARRRTLRDMTGTFYDEHLAREVAERLSASIATAIANLSPSTGGSTNG